MVEENGISRRRLLGSITTASGGIAGTGTASTKQRRQRLPDIDVEEVTGFEKWVAVRRAMADQRWKNIEQEVEVHSRIRPDFQSATATRVTEQNADKRYVVSVPYDTSQRSSENIEVFIQHYGFDQLETQPEYKDSELPNVVGQRAKSEQESERGRLETQGEGLESKTVYVEGKELKVESGNADNADLETMGISSIDEVYEPTDDPSSCDNCAIERGTNCAPSRECLVRVVGMVGGGVGCAGCALAPNWYNPPCYACVLTGISQGLMGTIDCLGCEGSEWVCIQDRWADEYCGSSRGGGSGGGRGCNPRSGPCLQGDGENDRSGSSPP
jgi:hypothetical protein